MEKRCLPLNFYCRSARLLLKKASFSRKSNLFAEELRHLKKFSTLAFSVIPSHPEYQNEKGRKLAEELEDCMDDVRERIAELEEELAGSACSASDGYRRSPSLSLAAAHKRLPVWEKLVRKLCCTPCFSSKATKMEKLVPPMTGFFTSSAVVSECRHPFITEVESHSSSETRKGNQLVLDMRHRRIEKRQVVAEEDEDEEETTQEDSSRSSGSGRGKMLEKMAEASNLNMEAKLLNIQTIVMEMRDSLESSKTRVEDEGKRWRGRAESMERKLKAIKDETDGDLSSLRQHLQEEVRKAAGEAEHKQSRELERLEESSSGEVKKFISESLGEVRAEVRSEMNSLEAGLDGLRREFAARYESLLMDLEAGRIGGGARKIEDVEVNQQINLLRNREPGGGR